VNGAKINDVAVEIGRKDALHGKYHLLRRGKKQFSLLVWQ
jgi:tyrosyl-tRNA synthetase